MLHAVEMYIPNKIIAFNRAAYVINVPTNANATIIPAKSIYKGPGKITEKKERS